MKPTLYIAVLSLFLYAPCGISAQELDFGGFIDSYHAVRLQDPYDFMSSRSRFRGEVRGMKGNSSFHASLNANHNYLLPERTFIELREAYMDYAGSGWDLRAGRQIIIWGVSDGIRITDIISPMDFTEFLARDYDDIRMPVDAMKFRAFTDFAKLEVIFVPLFQSFIYPTDPENPWSILPSGQDPVTVIAPADIPEPAIRNSELGGRVSFYLSGFDISLVSLYTWNKLPVFRTTLSEGMDTLLLFPEHHRMMMTGMDFSKPLGNLVVRGEGAFFSGEYYPSELNGNSNHLVRKNAIRYLVGLDWYPGGEWTVTGQVSHACIMDHIPELECDRHSVLATLGISKKLFRSSLALSTFGYMDLSSKGFFNRTSLNYSLSDQFHLYAGVDLFGGDGGSFGVYRDNSEVWIKVKYSF